MDQEKLIALESKLAYQEDHIQELNQSIYAMQKQIDQLELNYQIVKDKLSDMQSQMPSEIIGDEKPPHY